MVFKIAQPLVRFELYKLQIAMIKESTLEVNVNLYINLMEEKMMQDRKRIDELQNKIHDAARNIQRAYRRFIFYKKTMAARKIQRFWKKMMKISMYFRQRIQKFKKFYSTYKIYYFLKSLKGKPDKSNKVHNRNINSILSSKQSRQSYRIIEKIKQKCPNFMIYISSLQSQLAYLKKYALYDRKTFTQQWQAHEKKQREWMWAQIKKRWVKKDANIWINDAQKEINAEKYVNNLIQQTYTKQYQRLQQSQKKISLNIELTKQKIWGIKHAYYLSLLE